MSIRDDFRLRLVVLAMTNMTMASKQQLRYRFNRAVSVYRQRNHIRL